MVWDDQELLAVLGHEDLWETLVSREKLVQEGFPAYRVFQDQMDPQELKVTEVCPVILVDLV